MTSLASRLTSTVAHPSFRRLAATAVGLAVITNLLVWAVAGLVLGTAMQIVEPGSAIPTALGVGPVVAASIIPTALGLIFVGVLTALGRARFAAGVVGALTLASLAAPLTLDVGVGSRLGLALMHLVVGGLVVAVAVRADHR